jgi:hypothetical protein
MLFYFRKFIVPNDFSGSLCGRRNQNDFLYFNFDTMHAFLNNYSRVKDTLSIMLAQIERVITLAHVTEK